jgi:ankyrin repeat protein
VISEAGSSPIVWSQATRAALDSIDCALIRRLDHESLSATAYLMGRGISPAVDVESLDALVAQSGRRSTADTHIESLDMSSGAAVTAFLERRHREYRQQQATREALRRIEESGFSAAAPGMAHAAVLNDVESLRAFLHVGLSVNTRNQRGIPILHLAIRHGSWKCVNLILEHNPDINARAPDRDSTPLIEAASMKRSEIVARCLSAGAEVDPTNSAGQTALMIAVGHRDTQSAVALLGHGADPSRTDSLGMSAAKYAKLFGLESVVELIS